LMSPGTLAITSYSKIENIYGLLHGQIKINTLL